MKPRTTVRSIAVLLALALLATACGTMLGEEERRAAIRLQSGGGGGGAAGEGDELGDDEFLFDDDVAFDDTDLEDPAEGAEGSGGGAPGSPGAETTDPEAPGQEGGSGGREGGQERPGQERGQQQQQQDSGPRTASDVGVTPDKIVVANVSDISGPIPGIFESTRIATQAYAAYVNARGGIHGRQVDVLALDSRADASENRSATLQACERAFALVGSMSAFDMGGAGVVDECGIPDLTAIPVTAQRQQAQNTYGIYPERPDRLIITPAAYIRERFPDAIKRAALIYTDAPTTRLDGQKRRRGYEKIGYTFEMEAAISAVEANMAPFVLEMRRREISYVTGVMPFQQIVRLHEAMSQQGYRPEVTHWDSVVYDPGFIRTGGQNVEDVVFFINTHMFEEINQHEEMQRYVQWIRRVKPDAQPTYFGLYAWSAMALFEQAATEVGPELTRAALFDAIRGVNEWNGKGLHAPHDVGGKRPAPCVIHVQVRGGEFRRGAPSSGFDCRELVNV